MRSSRDTILKIDEVTKDMLRITVVGDFQDVKPGQFFMVRAWDEEPFLSRPLSVHDVTPSSLTFLMQVKGRGTQRIAGLTVGDSLELFGPCGNGFMDFAGDITGPVALVGGGVGIAPLYGLLMKLREAGHTVDYYAGFRDESMLLGDYARVASRTAIATESGKEGKKGFVTDVLPTEGYSHYFVCGPMPMMKAVYNKIKDTDAKAIFSLEEKMACGMGVCLGCAVETVNGVKRVCKDGPVFEGKEVFFK